MQRIKLIPRLVTCFLLLTLGGCAPGQSKLDANNPSGIAEKMAADGDLNGALQVYARALQQNPDDYAAHFAMARIYAGAGDDADAIQHFEAGGQKGRGAVEDYRLYGRSLVRLNRFDEAKVQYEKALSIDSDDAKSLTGYGVVLDTLGVHEKAREAYARVLKSDANNPAALNNLAHSYMIVGAYPQAIDVLEPHAKDPLDKPAAKLLHQNLAESYAMQGMMTDAERLLLLDNTGADVKKQLAAFAKKRKDMGLELRRYADCGAYPTEAMAKAKLQQIRESAGSVADGVVGEVKPAVGTIGGVPSFNLVFHGFASMDKVKAFCQILGKAGFSCKPVQ